jgi:ribosome-binding protein aMBF1 (putative translation factor)
MKREERRVSPKSPAGSRASDAARRRAHGSAAYRREQRRLAPYEEIARLVIKHRMEQGLTQRELAERMGTSHSAISRIESGRHKTSTETLRRLAAALGVRFVMGFESGPVEKPVRELIAV